MSGIFPGVIAYIIAALIVPTKPVITHMHHTEKQEPKPEEKKEEPKENVINL